ncbi:MAG: NADH-quinone oxidoreductase subunit H [Magnetococcales bacterium]|nr:NADH-quinone oxidoreductase subunit H [Magnetococcales bacterium]MBF0322944.1 NADH-quinone oxidoreductase subunit H [Magnetococcales bacterium]
MAMIVEFMAQGFQIALVLMVAPLVIGVVRKVKARLLRRRGPPVLQPYRDLAKLLAKDALMAENTSWIYRTVPYILFGVTWVATALIPTFTTSLTFGWAADLVAIVALLATGRFFLALAGMDVGTSFGGIGSSREMMFASLAEPAMLMVVFTVSILVGTTQLSQIAQFLIIEHVGLRVSLGLALMALIIVAIAENGRIPVDNPATHLELTMVHEAMVLEYSGRHLAMIEMAAALKLVLFLSMVASLFVPYGMAIPGGSVLDLGVGVATYLGKLLVGAVLLAIGETVVAKMRVFRVAEFLTIALVLGILAVVLLFVTIGI